ncbi:MAG: tetratricopeptide repeat protein [Cyanobacteria bacterium J06631_12]
MVTTGLDSQNQHQLSKLLVAVEANVQRLGLFLCVCDEPTLQARLIARYEAALRERNIVPLQVHLDVQQPSLKAVLETISAEQSVLRAGEPAMVTVLSTEELIDVSLDEEKSSRAQFFFSLQWTRESLRAFKFPVVLWMPDAMLTKLVKEAPDFWSWRRGVFEFAVEPTAVVKGVPPLSAVTAAEKTERSYADVESAFSIEELQLQISQLEQNNKESPLLITLYGSLGKAYAQEYSYEEALALYQKALDLAKKKNNLVGQVSVLKHFGDSLYNIGQVRRAQELYKKGLEIAQELEAHKDEADLTRKLGNTYYSRGEFQQAVRYQQWSLEISKKMGDRKGEARALNHLGNAYSSLGQYQRAVESHQQSLEIEKEMGDRKGEAMSFGNLGNAYSSLGQYQRAIELHQQSLEIIGEIGARNDQASSLMGLGNAYYSLGQYQRAIDFYLQSLEMQREMGDRNGEARALGNLGNAYDSLEQRQYAIDFYLQSLEIKREIGDRNGEASSLIGLGNTYNSLGQYQQAIEFCQQALEIKRAVGGRNGEARALGNIGNAYYSLGQYQRAIENYQQILEIQKEIGDRNGEALSHFNMGNALARIDEKWKAQSSYEAAKALYQDLGLEHRVEMCEKALRDLGQKIVVEPKQAPDITPTTRRKRKQLPLFVYFLLGIALVLLLWWLFS